MIEWLLVAVLFYALALVMLHTNYSGPLQTLTWKLGHVTLGGFAGYWLDRTAFRVRMCAAADPLMMIRRAIIMAAAMYTLGTGL
ncbi:hypothetical protein ACZ75_10845 [Massilia sp. NR 4-1]|nr:hypothetical protein ACZ75_10845 [Massilia sp. NR 4-1]